LSLTILRLLVAFGAWLPIAYYAATKMECVRPHSCGPGDLLAFGIIAVTLLAPAWIVFIAVGGRSLSDDDGIEVSAKWAERFRAAGLIFILLFVVVVLVDAFYQGYSGITDPEAPPE
jgi:hypothetical protein